MDDHLPTERLLKVHHDQMLALLYPPKKTNNQGILFIHGWKSSQNAAADYVGPLIEKGYLCLTFDLRGMGRSGGDVNGLSRKDFLEDCVAAYDFLKSQPGIETISVVGSSFGSYMACLLSARRPVKTLVLRVPADYTNEGFDTGAQVLISDQLDQKGHNGPKPDIEGSYALDALSHFDGKVLVVQSGNDDIVSPEVVSRFIKTVPANNLKHTIMTGAPHSLSASPKFKKQFALILKAWF